MKYCFDDAVYTFGKVVESELNKVTNEAKNDKEAVRKRTAVLNRMLNEGTAKAEGKGEKKTPGKGVFQDPAARFGKQR